MEEEEGGGIRLSKRFSDKGGEVDYKTKSGTAWSHNFLNQKPWHPLSYPNQRRKWIAEQTHAEKQRRSEEVSREYAQEQEFYRQAALVSKKEKEKMEMMQAVSFMYVRPPGYNAESAKAAEMADERKNQEPGQNIISQDMSVEGSSSSRKNDLPPSGAEKKKPRPKDVFGRALPTEEQFDVLKNAPRLDTGVAARSKPFGVEIRNVKCLRCGNFGHQSGDRECPLKDAIMPSEESRLKRDDPLTAILAQTDSGEPLKWELKQKPGCSPPRGGFNPDDPNQQIVAEDIFDEYGGFLGADVIPELLTNFSSSKHKKKHSKKKHKRRPSPASTEVKDRGKESYDNREHKSKERTKKSRRKHSGSATSEDSESDASSTEYDRRSSRKKRHKRKSSKYSEPKSSDGSDYDKHREKGRRHRHSRHASSESSDSDGRDRRKRNRHTRR